MIFREWFQKGGSVPQRGDFRMDREDGLFPRPIVAIFAGGRRVRDGIDDRRGRIAALHFLTHVIVDEDERTFGAVAVTELSQRSSLLGRVVVFWRRRRIVSQLAERIFQGATARIVTLCFGYFHLDERIVVGVRYGYERFVRFFGSISFVSSDSSKLSNASKKISSSGTCFSSLDF